LSNPVLNRQLSRLHYADEDVVFLADQLWFITRIQEEEEEEEEVDQAETD